MSTHTMNVLRDMRSRVQGIGQTSSAPTGGAKGQCGQCYFDSNRLPLSGAFTRFSQQR